MVRFLGCLTLLGLVLGMFGCTQQRVIRDLPGPLVPPAPAPSRIEKPPVTPPPPLTAVNLRGRRLVIDAGHGGKDPGTRGVSATHEKHIVLSVANELARVLAVRGATVVSTRKTDRFLELDDRAAIADRNRADLFVSVHADSAQRTTASGATIYIGRNASWESQKAAMRIDAALKKAGIETRGVERAGFRVLVAHSRPAVLVECGYLTNAGDARRLNTPAYRTRLAAAIADGVTDYLLR